MYYLLKLETVYSIRVGTKIVTEPENTKHNDNLFFVLEQTNDYIVADADGLFWNGKKVFREIGEEYEDVVTDETYNISYTIFCENDIPVNDELYDEFDDLFINDLLPQWSDLNEPIIFLMEIKGYKTWTDCGYEYDIEHCSVKTIADADFAKML